jgi:hypothetical protein
MSPLRQRAAWLALAVAPILPLLASQLPLLWQLAAEPSLPRWDMAKYGVSGLRLAGALATFDLGGFLAEVNALSVWPPLFPLLEAPFFLAFGKSETVAARLVVALWAATLLLLPWALRPVSSTRSPAAGWLAAAALASGSLLSGFAALVMLEVPGLFLQVLALGFALRAISGGQRAWKATYLCCTLLFFCKYNYGLLFIVPLLIFRRRLASAGTAGNLASEGTADFLADALTAAKRLPWRSPWLLFFLLAGAALSLIRLTGGFELALLGHEISLRSIGNPALFLLLLGLVRLLWGSERRRATLAALREFDRETQGLWRWLGAPLLAWLLLPPHLKDFLDFVENRSSRLPLLSAENLLFYPRIYLAELAPSPAFGLLILALALLGLARLRGAGPRALLGWWLLAAGAAVFFHPYKQDRFLIPGVILPLTALAAAIAANGLERLPGRAARWAPLLAGLVALAAVAGSGPRQDELRRVVALHSAPAELAEPIDAALAAAREEPALLLGSFDLASPWLAEWRAWAAQPGWRPPRLALLPGDLGIRREDGERLAGRLAEGPPLVLLIQPLAAAGPSAEAWAAENVWLAPVRARLDDARLFQPEPAREFPAAGFRLAAWRRLPTRPVE